MNNTTFGDEDMGYYETVAGGTGAVSDVIIKSRYSLLALMAAFCDRAA